MDKIEVAVLNPAAVSEAERMMVAMARLTQRGHKISNMEDMKQLYLSDYKQSTVEAMAKLPHPTIQKFGVINIAVVGASRRFLAQITRHQNEVKFMSGSLQYSNYSGAAQFVVPYEIIKETRTGNRALLDQYLDSCKYSLQEYETAIEAGLNNDAAGYMMPQGLRNVLIISATPFQLKHMISQRICRRNTTETMYVMLLLWEALWPLSAMFRIGVGPSCIKHKCEEGKMSCCQPLMNARIEKIMERDQCSVPTALIKDCFPFIERCKE